MGPSFFLSSLHGALLALIKQKCFKKKTVDNNLLSKATTAAMSIIAVVVLKLPITGNLKLTSEFKIMETIIKRITDTDNSRILIAYQGKNCEGVKRRKTKRRDTKFICLNGYHPIAGVTH